MLLFCALLGSLNWAKPALRGRGIFAGKFAFTGEVGAYRGSLSSPGKFMLMGYLVLTRENRESYNFKRTSNPGCDTEVALENDGQPCEVCLNFGLVF